MNEIVREAASKIFNWYTGRYDSPHLNQWAGSIPADYVEFLGFSGATVITIGDLLTIKRASHLDGFPGGVPCMPWEQPNSLNSVPRDISHVLRAVAQAPILATIAYGQDAGRELCALDRIKMRGTQRWPRLHIGVSARKVPGEGRVFKLELDEELKLCEPYFSCVHMAETTKSEDIYLQTGLTGRLMISHAGLLEYRGSDVPLLLRDKDRDLISLIQPAPAPKLSLKLTEEEIYQQAKLPGLWSDELEKLAREQDGAHKKTKKTEAAGDDDGEDEDTEGKEE